MLDGSGLAGGFTVAAAQTLKGSGTVIGPVTVNGTVAPEPDGLLTFSNRLVLAGNTVMRLGRFGSPRGSDMIRVAGVLDCGGSLTVSNLYQPARFGDTFKLFDAAVLAGSFASLHLPPVGRGLQWDLDRLAADGTLRVIAVPPQILPFIFNNRVLVVRFQTALGPTYVLESTPSLEPPSNWTTVATRAGTGGLNTIPVSVEQSTPQRFFRLRTD